MIRRSRALVLFTFATALAAVLVLSAGTVAFAATKPANIYPGNGATVPLTASNGWWFYDFRWTPGQGLVAISYSIKVYTAGNELVWISNVLPSSATSFVSTQYGLPPGSYKWSVTEWCEWGDVVDSPVTSFTVPQSSGLGATSASLSPPTISPSRPKRGKYAAFSSLLTPGAAASGTSSELLLYHQETKTVRKRINGKMRKVKVKYWRLRTTTTMTPGAAGASTKFTGRFKPKYAGKWRAVASFSGGAGYAASKSSARAFTVK
jgi:hypothetical protein